MGFFVSPCVTQNFWFLFEIVYTKTMTVLFSNLLFVLIMFYFTHLWKIFVVMFIAGEWHIIQMNLKKNTWSVGRSCNKPNLIYLGLYPPHWWRYLRLQHVEMVWSLTTIREVDTMKEHYYFELHSNACMCANVIMYANVT